MTKGKRWIAAIRIKGISYTVGLFDVEMEAHEAYQKALKDWLEEQKIPDYKVRIPTSKYKGIVFHITNKKWEAKLIIEGKHYSLGSHNTEEEAYRVRCKFEEGYLSNGITPHYVNPKLSSKFKYVSYIRGKWQASSNKVNGKIKYLGVYSTQEEAAEVVRIYLGLDELLTR